MFLFKSREITPEKNYAVKVLLKHMMTNRAVDNIRSEIAVLSLMDHTNIIKFVESFEDERYMYIVTEYVESSRDLSDIMTEVAQNWNETDPLLPVDDVRKLMRMVLSGVTHMHASGVVHRDLKPGNCLLDAKFGLNIIDFGLAITIDSVQEKNYILGTPMFMAPEIYLTRGASTCYKEPVDIWACGVMLYQLLSGHYPFYDKDSD